MATTEAPKTESPKIEAPAVETTAATVAPVKSAKGKQVSATVPADLYDFLDDLHWTQRLSLTDLFRTAIDEYAGKHGYSPKA